MSQRPPWGGHVALGVADGHDAGACLVVDGRVVAAVNEERLAGVKNYAGIPFKSIQEVLRLARCDPAAATGVALATRAYLTGSFGARKGLVYATASGPLRLASEAGFARLVMGTRRGVELMCTPLRMVRSLRVNAIRSYLKSLGFAAPIEVLDHHLTHAASAYYTSGWERCAVVTLDYWGDGYCSRVYRGRDGALQELDATPMYHSIGAYYSHVTELLGFVPLRHEGKVMGLAAHGHPSKTSPILRQRIAYLRDRHAWRNYGKVDQAELAYLRKALRGFSREDIAAGIQRVCEEEVVAFVAHALAATQERCVAVAGGVFANVRLNQLIRELPGVEGMYVFPHMGDGGIAVGAALASWGRRLPSDRPSVPYQPRRLEHAYLGAAFSHEEIKEALNRAGLSFDVDEDIEESIGALLAQGYTVCRFDGPMEYGPRALGNRSILCAPTDPSVHDWLNAALKRSEFMPFAPSALEEVASQCFLGVRTGYPAEHRFMTATYTATPWCKQHAPAVVHVDGTARPQTVSRLVNPSFHKILGAFQRRTGLPLLINTSFNMHESPIVNSPHDAIRAFQQSGLHYLAIGHALIRNPNSAWPKVTVPSSAPQSQPAGRPNTPST